MTETKLVQHNEHKQGDWRPAYPVALAPINTWPLQLQALSRWFFGWPGYLWPYNAFWVVVAVITWVFLTPGLQAMQSIEVWWVGLLLARNFAFTLLVFGGLHLYFYVLRGQGDKLRFSLRPFAVSNRRFRFKNQVRDNMFHTLVYAVPVFTAFEVITYWGVC